MSFNRINYTNGRQSYSVGTKNYNFRNLDDVKLNNTNAQSSGSQFNDGLTIFNPDNNTKISIENGRININANTFNQQFNNTGAPIRQNVNSTNNDIPVEMQELVLYMKFATKYNKPDDLQKMKEEAALTPALIGMVPTVEDLLLQSEVRKLGYKFEYGENSIHYQEMMVLEQNFVNKALMFINVNNAEAFWNNTAKHLSLIDGSPAEQHQAYLNVIQGPSNFSPYGNGSDIINVAVNSFAVGLLTPLENIFDGLVMAGGTLSSLTVSIFSDEAASNIESIVSDIVSYDVMGNVYAQQVKGINPNLAYGKLHQYSKAAGTMVGYVVVSSVGASTFSSMGTSMGMTSSQAALFSNLANGAVGGFAASGSSAQNAFMSGATFDEAAKVSAIAFGAGFASSAGLDKIGQLAKGANSMWQVGGYTLAGMGVAASEPLINSVAEYNTYGKDMVDENGNPLYQNFFDYYKESGGLLNTMIAAGAGGLSTSGKAVRGYKINTQMRNTAILDDIIRLSDSDINALLSDAELKDYYRNWSKREVSSFLHNKFDNTFGAQTIDDMINRIHKVQNWEDFIKSRPDTKNATFNLLGFVDKNNNLYLPDNANKHSATHEAFHQVSEINARQQGAYAVDAFGNQRKITGIKEFFDDGFDSNWANETLTDYLASKYDDGKFYNTMYDKNKVKYWNRIDEVMQKVYGIDNDVLLQAYVFNDTNFLRNFFDQYSTAGSYDDFIRAMPDLSYTPLENIVSSIEKNVYKVTNKSSIKSILSSIFGGN